MAEPPAIEPRLPPEMIGGKRPIPLTFAFISNDTLLAAGVFAGISVIRPVAGAIPLRK
jgi:hypothetical protein